MSTVISAYWNPDAAVWVARNAALGLATEAGSLDELQLKLPRMVKELQAQNATGTADVESRPNVVIRCQTRPVSLCASAQAEC